MKKNKTSLRYLIDRNMFVGNEKIKEKLFNNPRYIYKHIYRLKILFFLRKWLIKIYEWTRWLRIIVDVWYEESFFHQRWNGRFYRWTLLTMLHPYRYLYTCTHAYTHVSLDILRVHQPGLRDSEMHDFLSLLYYRTEFREFPTRTFAKVRAIIQAVHSDSSKHTVPEHTQRSKRIYMYT